MNKRLKILWLPAWLPSKVDFLNGDFVQRHAIAVSKFADVVVLFVVKDESLILANTLIELQEKEGLSVYTGYYNSSIKNIFLKKIKLIYIYFYLLFKLYYTAKKRHGIFNLVHVHISSKQGLFALWLKFVKGINYVITEHSGWFMPIGKDIFTRNIFTKIIIKINYKYASAIHVVSQNLGIQLQKKYQFIKSVKVIPNVVDNSIFFYKQEMNKELPTNFLAINGNNFQKNIDGIIRSFSTYLKNGNDAFLHIAGPNDEALKILVKELDLNDSVKFYGTVANEIIASLMQKTDAFVFFTRFESFGCVMAEALCCGKPIIASNLDVLRENLEENINALFVESENEKDLTDKLIYFTNNKSKFDNNKIAEDAKAKFNFDKVGKDFLTFYNSVLEK